MSKAQILKHNNDPFLICTRIFCIANDATYTYTNTYTITNTYTYNRVRFFRLFPRAILSFLSES